MKEKTYFMIKPEFARDSVVVKEILNRVAKLGLQFDEFSFVRYTREDAQKHYSDIFRGSYENAKGFYRELEDYITSDRAIGFVISGEDAISKVRHIAGATKIENLKPGTIRYDIPKMINKDFDLTKNVVHSSSCVEDAEKEINIFHKLKRNALARYYGENIVIRSMITSAQNNAKFSNENELELER